jgi:hypothetical protein
MNLAVEVEIYSIKKHLGDYFASLDGVLIKSQEFHQVKSITLPVKCQNIQCPVSHLRGCRMWQLCSDQWRGSVLGR